LPFSIAEAEKEMDEFIYGTRTKGEDAGAKEITRQGKGAEDNEDNEQEVRR
jgi:hypothetical protein